MSRVHFATRWKFNWIQGNTKIWPVLEVTTRYLQGKHGVEIRIQSVNKDNSHSWVRISHGLNKLVTDLIDREYETSTTKMEVFSFASLSKAKAKPRRLSTACSFSRTVPILERIWIDIEPGTPSNLAYPVANRINTLLRHGELPREKDGAIEFWRLKDDLQNKFWVLSILVWWCMEEHHGRRRRQQEKISILCWFVRTRNSLPSSSPRSFRTQSHWSLFTGQCINSEQFLWVHLSYWITNSGLIPGGQILSNRQTVFFLPVDPMDKQHKDPETVDLKAPRLAQYLHKAWKKHKTRCIGSTSDLLKRKDWSSIRRDRAPSSFTIHSQPVASRRLFRWKLEKSYTKKYLNYLDRLRRFPWNNWMKELGSKVAGQAESSQPTQPNPNPIYRTRRPVMTEQTSCWSAQEIDTRFLLGCESTSLSVERLDKNKDADENVDADRVRTGRPVGCEQSELFTQREEMDIDFRVSGLPHAVAKQTENFRVRELVKKIESHPHRQALQADLQQSNAYNPFSGKSKKMIRDMGNVELFELCETIPRVRCSGCLLHWNQGIVYCTCGHLLRGNKSSRRIHRRQLDILSIPNHVIKKERPHGNRHWKTEEQIKHFIAHNLREMHQIEFWRSSRSLSERFKISWLATQIWSDWGKVHPDWRGGAGRFHQSHVVRRAWEIQKELVDLSQHIWTKCTDETSVRLRRSINKDAPSSPWVWRRATCTDSFLAVSEMASVVFFIQHIMVAVERSLVELTKFIKVKHLWRFFLL